MIKDNYTYRFLKASLLTHQDEKSLIDKEEFEEVLLAHARMVIKQANYYSTRYHAPFQDLFQEGMLGLIRAVRKFSTAYNVRFSTYAKWWIKASIQNFILRNWSIVRCSSRYKVVLFSKMKTNVTNIRHYDGQIPTLDMSLDYIMEYTVLDFPISDEANSAEEAAFKSSEKKKHMQYVEEAFESLDPLEKEVISKRYLSDPAVPYKNLNTELNITLSSLQKIEKKALRKMHSFLKNKRVRSLS